MMHFGFNPKVLLIQVKYVICGTCSLNSRFALIAPNETAIICKSYYLGTPHLKYGNPVGKTL